MDADKLARTLMLRFLELMLKETLEDAKAGGAVARTMHLTESAEDKEGAVLVPYISIGWIDEKAIPKSQTGGEG